MKPTSTQIAETATEYVLRDPPPAYAEMDCYRFVRRCVRDNGGDMRYAGSNDVFRNGLAECMPLRSAADQGRLRPGWALFIVRDDSDATPAKYRGDGRGDAYHMGLYTDRTPGAGERARVEVAHSSQSRGIVCASTLQNAWNWAGRLKDVDYAQDGAPGAPADEGAADAVPAEQASEWGVVTTESGDLIMRGLPGGNDVRGQAYLLKIPRGARIEILRQERIGGTAWGLTRHANRNGIHTGWVSMDFVRLEASPEARSPDGAAPDGTPQPAGYMLIISALDNRPLTAEQVSGLIGEISGSGYQAEIIPIAAGEDESWRKSFARS